MGLSWRGIEGQYFDQHGKLVAFDPSVNVVGPGALLIDRDSFLSFLDSGKYSLLWVITGEKIIIDGGFGTRDNWPGRLNILGLYRLEDGRVSGKIITDISD